jgi:Coenzyme PQQ synthesis protein D (PqqD)
MEKLGLRVNAPQVICETIDGEVIVINLASGTYYSVRGAGADAWEVIQSAPGIDRHAVATVLASRFDRPADLLENDIAAFLDQLRQEGLVVEADVGQEPVISGAGSNGAQNAAGAQQGYEPPLLEKYTDMQDLVLIDPVHEVDATGWPHTKAQASQT